MSCISAAQLKFEFQNDLGRENSASYYRYNLRSGLIISIIFLASLLLWLEIKGEGMIAGYYRQGRQLLLTLLAMITRWSRSLSNFYAVIGQNLTVEFMRKIYAAS